MTQTYVNFGKIVFTGVINIDGEDVETWEPHPTISPDKDVMQFLHEGERDRERFLATDYNDMPVMEVMSDFEADWCLSYDFPGYIWTTYQKKPERQNCLDASRIDPRKIHVFQTLDDEYEELLMIVESHPEFDDMSLDEALKVTETTRPIFYREVRTAL